MDTIVTVGVPLAVGIPDNVAKELLAALASMGLGAADGPQGAGNLLVMVAQPVAVGIADNILQDLQAAINAVTSGPAILGPANPIPSQPAQAPAQPTPIAPSGNDPGDFRAAIDAAGAEFGVPPILLERIWHIEAGGAFPNPCLNDGTHTGGCFTAAQAPHGFGGLFGLNQDDAVRNGFSLDDPGTTVQQAQLAASTLAHWHSVYGTWLAAANTYNTGSPNSGYGSQVAWDLG